jgi:HemY protein
MMKYIIAVLIFVAALAGVLLFIGDDPSVTISSVGAASGVKANLNFEGQFSWQAVIVIMTLCVIGLLILWSFLTWLWRLPGRFKTGQGLRRGARTIDAIEEALLAGADGDADKARKKAARAQSLIKSPILGHLIGAQTAEAAGDIDQAAVHYKALQDNSRTRAIAEKGLVRQSMAGGQLADVISRAGAAFDQDKPARWAFDPLFRARVMNGDWQEASDVLAKAVKRGLIEKAPARRRRAVLMTAEAQRIMRTEDINKTAIFETMRDMAVSAAAESPDFAPGVALAAQILSERSETKQAAKLIEKAWAQAPHPALSLAYRDLYRDASPRAKAKRLSSLIKQNPSHRETTILQIEAALDKGDFVQGWSLLNPLVSETPTARLCALAARAEDGLSNPADARMWLERGVSAPSEADWSDLDPEGNGFDYTVRDWQRLVFSFGETGELIHPRLEAGAARKSVPSALAGKEDAAQEDKAKEDAAKEDAGKDEGSIGEKDPLIEPDLADRLDNLLESSKRSNPK